jgi:hypothetical protein
MIHIWANQKSVAYLSGLNHNEKSIPFFISSSVAGPIFSRSYNIVQKETRWIKMSYGWLKEEEFWIQVLSPKTTPKLPYCSFK